MVSNFKIGVKLVSNHIFCPDSLSENLVNTMAVQDSPRNYTSKCLFGQLIFTADEKQNSKQLLDR